MCSFMVYFSFVLCVILRSCWYLSTDSALKTDEEQRQAELLSRILQRSVHVGRTCIGVGKIEPCMGEWRYSSMRS